MPPVVTDKGSPENERDRCVRLRVSVPPATKSSNGWLWLSLYPLLNDAYRVKTNHRGQLNAVCSRDKRGLEIVVADREVGRAIVRDVLDHSSNVPHKLLEAGFEIGFHALMVALPFNVVGPCQ